MTRCLRSLPLAAALPVLAACGSSAGPSSTVASGNSGAPNSAALVAFSDCMRTHGVPNFPDLGSNGHGGLAIQQSQRSGSGPSITVNGVPVNGPAFQSAMQVCRSKLPNGGHPPPVSASQRAAMLRYSQCMRTHGVPSFPDPIFGAGGGVGFRFNRSSGIDPRSPAFQHAQTACAYLGGPKPIAAPAGGASGS